MDTIIYVKVTYTDVKYYIFCPLENLMETQEKEKKKKHLLL